MGTNDMLPFVNAAFGAVAFIYGVVLMLLWGRVGRDQAGLWWGIGCVVIGLRYAAAGMANAGFNAFVPVEAALSPVSSPFLLLGAYSLVGRPAPVKTIAGIFSLCVFVLLALSSTAASTETLLQAQAAVHGVAYIWIGAVILLASKARQSALLLFFAAMSGLAGLSWLATFIPVPAYELRLSTSIIRGFVLIFWATTFALLLQRNRAEELAEALKQARVNEQRFADLVEVSSDWVWETDADLRFTFLSPQIHEITGVPAESYIGRTRLEMSLDPDWRKEAERIHDRMLRRETLQNSELRYVKRTTGEHLIFNVSGKPFHDQTGRFVGYRGVGRDVTQVASTKAALETIVGAVGNTVGQAYLQSVVEYLGRSLRADAAVVVTLDRATMTCRSEGAWVDNAPKQGGAVFPVNDAPFGALFDSNTLVVEKGLAERYPGIDRFIVDKYSSLVAAALHDNSGETIGGVFVLRHAPMADAPAVETVLRALAPRISAELERQITDQRLRESEARFHSVLDQLPIAVSVKEDDRYVYVNSTHALWCGVPAEEMEGLNEATFNARMGWGEAGRAGAERTRRKVLETGRVDMREVTLPMAGGAMRTLLVATFPFRREGGEAERRIGVVITDLTEQRRLEANLAQMQKMESLGRLAGGIAHDFNNIVGAITGFARFIAQDSPPDSTQAEHAERILSASARAKQLIQQIMTFSGRSTVARQRLDLNAAVTEAANLLRATLPTQTTLDIHLADHPVIADADPSQIGQILVNLCINANDALEKRPGNVAVRVYRDRPPQSAALRIGQVVEQADGLLRRIDGRINPEIDYAVVEVSDSGTGITRPVMEQIFEPFFTTKPMGQGTGLGLPVVHGIVQAHGGALEIGSKPGAGATFRLWLPETIGDTASELPAAPPLARLGNGLSVLLIDDDDDFGDMVAVTLERLGCEVAVMRHPTEALAVFENTADHWDLVISDKMMPDLSGLDLIRILKQRRPDLPCILCTGLGRSGGEAEASAAGADAYLLKPLDTAVLTAVARQLLSKGTGTRPDEPRENA